MFHFSRFDEENRFLDATAKPWMWAFRNDGFFDFSAYLSAMPPTPIAPVQPVAAPEDYLYTDIPGDTSTTETLTIGTDFSGTLETDGDRDWIKVSLTAGTSYLFRLQGDGAAIDAVLKIYDTNGNLLAGKHDLSQSGFEGRLGFTADITGVYYIEASAFDSFNRNYSETGDYILTSANLGNDVREDIHTSESLEIGGTYTGTIDTPSDRDWIRIDLEAGKQYLFQLETGHISSELRLLDSNGDLVSSGPTPLHPNGVRLPGWFDRLPVTIETSGTYYLEVNELFRREHDNIPAEYTVTAIEVDANDLPETEATPARILNGETYLNELEHIGDRDWIRVDVEAGRIYEFTVSGHGGNPLQTPFVGAIVFAKHIWGDNYLGDEDSSTLTFIARETGTIYLEVFSGYDTPVETPDGETAFAADRGMGGYSLSMTARDLPTYSPEEIADYLTTGFWNDFDSSPHSFNASTGDFITVDLTGLTQKGLVFARAALQLWSDATGLIFQETSNGSQIIFEDHNPGGYAWSLFDDSGNITQSVVNVSTELVDYFGIHGFGGYALNIYIHEIGHALGLGHAGDYNGSADFLSDAHYANDSWQTTIMSYFSQSENPYNTNPYAIPITPQLADIVAIRNLYGSGEVREGDTTYGFNHNTGSPVFGANVHNDRALTIIDTGGNDTLDYSLATHHQTIDLRPGSFSSVQGDRDALFIFFDTIIENAIGGDGIDTIVGNDVRNRIYAGGNDDVVHAGLGNDLVYGGLGNDTLNGEDGRDYILGEDGDDIISGGADDDTAAGGAGNDHLVGEDGDDRLYGNDGSDTILGGTGADILVGGLGDDQLGGGAGNDKIRAGEGNDSMSAGGGDDMAIAHGGDDIIVLGDGADFALGGQGNDQIYGDNGNDRIGGGGGNDLIFGGLGDDIVTGNGGDDRFIGGGGDDRFDGGGGRNDRAVFSGNYSDYSVNHHINAGLIVVSDTRGAAADGTDRLFNVEILEFADGIVTVSGGELIFSSNESSQILDTLHINLDEGELAVADMETPIPHGTFSLSGIDSDLFQINQSTGEISLRDYVWFHAPQDTDGDNIYDLLVLSENDGRRSYQRVHVSLEDLYRPISYHQHNGYGTSQNDELIGTSSQFNNLYGYEGDDILRGHTASDWLYAGTGDDLLYGRGGNDYLYDTDSGNGSLFGGDGDDTFYVIRRVGVSENSTVVIDGEAGNDVLFLTDYGSGAAFHASMGSGDDSVTVNYHLTSNWNVDLGDGDDSFHGSINQPGLLTLGMGRDSIHLTNYSAAGITVTDFTAGTAGDRVVLDASFFDVLSWNSEDDPFEYGILRWVQVGADVLLQSRYDTESDRWHTAITLENVDINDITADNISWPSENSAAETQPLPYLNFLTDLGLPVSDGLEHPFGWHMMTPLTDDNDMPLDADWSLLSRSQAASLAQSTLDSINISAEDLAALSDLWSVGRDSNGFLTLTDDSNDLTDIRPAGDFATIGETSTPPDLPQIGKDDDVPVSQVAQLVEQRTENPRVGGSNPPLCWKSAWVPASISLFTAKTVTTVHGVEPSATLRKRAEQETRSTSLPIELYDVSAEDMPFDDNSYDTIVSTWTMCSIPLLEAALAEARRVLKPGGELLFVEHGRADSDGVRKWQNRLNPVQKAIGGGCNLNRPIAEQIETAGFDIQSLKTGHLMKGPKIATYTFMGRACPK